MEAEEAGSILEKKIKPGKEVGEKRTQGIESGVRLPRRRYRRQNRRKARGKEEMDG